MQQWYQCPRCGKDILYGTNPCPYCKCSLAWSQQGPILYIPPPGAPQQPPPQYQQQYQQPHQDKQQTKRTTISRKPSRIARLPQVSDSFINHINNHTLVKNEWVPCPQCGQGTVDKPSGKAIGCLAGSALIVWWIICFTIAAIIAGIFFWPLAIGIIIGGIIGIFLLPLIGTALGLVYRCKSCNYSWKFEDIENYKQTIS